MATKTHTMIPDPLSSSRQYQTVRCPECGRIKQRQRGQIVWGTLIKGDDSVKHRLNIMKKDDTAVRHADTLEVRK